VAKRWTFLTTDARALLCISGDLAGYIVKEKDGRVHSRDAV
jgi:hypothetical protein